jgi:hypothetical protein
VTVTGYALNSGADAPNYTLSQPSGLTANITKAATTATITSSANPSAVGNNVTFTYTVTATTPTTNPPTGTVVIYTNIGSGNKIWLSAAALGSNTPTAATVSFSTALLPLGTNKVEGVYNGDANFSNPNDPVLSQVVQNTTCSKTNRIVSITANGGNSFTLTNIGTYQAQYYLLSQTNISQAMTNWLPVSGTTNTVTNASGLWSVTVTNRAPAFYRVKAMSSCQ